jgi:hypothetical protein
MLQLSTISTPWVGHLSGSEGGCNAWPLGRGQHVWCNYASSQPLSVLKHDSSSHWRMGSVMGSRTRRRATASTATRTTRAAATRCLASSHLSMHGSERMTMSVAGSGQVARHARFCEMCCWQGTGSNGETARQTPLASPGRRGRRSGLQLATPQTPISPLVQKCVHTRFLYEVPLVNCSCCPGHWRVPALREAVVAVHVGEVPQLAALAGACADKCAALGAEDWCITRPRGARSRLARSPTTSCSKRATR